MMRIIITFSVLASFVGASLASPALAADVAPKTSLVNLVDEGQAWLKMATAGPTTASDPAPRSTADAPTAMGPERTALGEQRPFFDVSPHASVIARDWRGSMKIVGDRSMLVDDLRPTHRTAW